MTVRIDKVVTSGQFHLDGGTWDVDNNVWLVGDDENVVVIDAAHDAFKIAEAVGDRHVLTILCTHGHDDHVNAAPALAKITKADIGLHPADDVLWKLAHPHAKWNRELGEDYSVEVAPGHEIKVLHTPGHSPGSLCFTLESMGVVFTGDTLFQGGPGATGRSYSDHDEILNSIATKLAPLPRDTVVHTGHGEDTTIGAETS